MGIVLATLAPSKENLQSVSLPFTSLRFGGAIEDTRHFGMTKKSGARENQYPRGTEIFNYRQVSLVEESELQSIAQALGIKEVSAQALGANILVSGIPGFTKLPPTTRLYFEGGATIVIFGENDPCIHPGKVLETEYAIANLAPRFVKAAIGRRGVIGWVEKEGNVFPQTLVKIAKPGA